MDRGRSPVSGCRVIFGSKAEAAKASLMATPPLTACLESNRLNRCSGSASNVSVQGSCRRIYGAVILRDHLGRSVDPLLFLYPVVRFDFFKFLLRTDGTHWSVRESYRHGRWLHCSHRGSKRSRFRDSRSKLLDGRWAKIDPALVHVTIVCLKKIRVQSPCRTATLAAMTPWQHRAATRTLSHIATRFPN